MSEKTTVKDEIQKAFLDLMIHKSYMEITVSDLVNKAQVSRMSFYRNFNSLDDVIESIADDMIKDFSVEIIPVIKENNERKWREMLFEMIYHFMHVQKNLGVPFNEFAKNRPNNNIVMSRVHEKLMEIKNGAPEPDHIEKYRITCRMHIIQGIILEWGLTGMQETPEEIIDIIVSIALKI